MGAVAFLCQQWQLIKWLLTCGGQAAAAASWYEASVADEMGTAIIW